MGKNKETVMTDSYCIQVLYKNGESQSHLADKFFYIEDICKGGFRFLSEVTFEVEDRVKVRLRFPDEHTQEVFGRICYSDEVDDHRTAYGFSILDGFYLLIKSDG